MTESDRLRHQDDGIKIVLIQFATQMKKSRKFLLKAMPLWKNCLKGAAISFFLLLAAEIILSLIGIKPYLVTEDPFVGFSEKLRLFVEQTQNDGTVILSTAENKQFYFNKQKFNKNKEKNTYRIFCMGESTTYGHPYTDSLSFCGWLREFLPVADPSRSWEVINAGGISYASYRVTSLMEELGNYEPDLFIIYSGHNEFLEHRTYEQLREMPRIIVTLNEILGQTRLYTALKALIDLSGKLSPPLAKRHEMPGEVQEILNHTVGPSSYTRDDRLKTQIIDHYRFNLQRMVKLARLAGSDILFITPAANLKDMSPFKSELSANLTDEAKKRWASLYEQGVALMNAKLYEQALASFREALAIDKRHAELNYHIGQILFELKKFAEAKVALQNALDEDIAPLRILSEMRQIVIDVAREQNVPLVDFADLLEKNYSSQYGHAIPGKEYFVDHVHLSYQGYRMLALTILDKMAKLRIVKPTSSWNDEAIATVSNIVEKGIDNKMHATSLINLGKVLDWAGKLKEGNEALIQSYNIYPDIETLFLISRSFSRMGNNEKAIEYLERILQIEHNNIIAYERLAGIYEEQERFEDALNMYNKILEIKPDDSISHNNIGMLLLSLERWEEAITHLNEAIRIDPGLISAHTNLVNFYSETGRIAEAISQYETLLQIDPDNTEMLIKFGVLLAKEGQVEAAARQFDEAVRSAPASELAHYNLARALHILGKTDEARDHYLKTIDINPNSAEAYNNLGVIFAQQGNSDKAEYYFSEARQIRQGVNR